MEQVTSCAPDAEPPTKLPSTAVAPAPAIPKEILARFGLRGDDYVWVQSAPMFIQIVPIKFAPKFQDATVLDKMEEMEEKT